MINGERKCKETACCFHPAYPLAVPDRQLLMDAVGRLNAREKEIITLRFGLGGGEEKTQKEVADILGISQSYISRLEKKIMRRLKKEISKMM